MLKSILNCKSNSVYSFELCDTVTGIDVRIWDELNHINNIYLSISYLSALEKGMSDTMEFRYLTFFNNKREPIGIAVFQLVKFQTKELLQERIPCSIGDKVQSYFLNDKDLSLLICGNLYACGENGFAFSEKINRESFLKLLGDAMLEVQNSKINGSKISFSLIKELWISSEESFKALDKASFLNFNVDVNMILKMRPEWSDFNTYLESMNTKYRTRAKAVFKKSREVSNRNLEVEAIAKHLHTIEILYKQVLDKADYNLGILKVKTFLELKKKLGDSFVFTGYFLEEKLIGFTS